VREIGMAVKKNAGTKSEIKEATIKNITSLMTAAFGLVAALAWNSAIQKIFSLVFGAQGGVYAMVSYAVVVTLIAVVVTVYLGRLLGKLGVV
jgi:membrane associated rhomboid family serine protease